MYIFTPVAHLLKSIEEMCRRIERIALGRRSVGVILFGIILVALGADFLRLMAERTLSRDSIVYIQQAQELVDKRISLPDIGLEHPQLLIVILACAAQTGISIAYTGIAINVLSQVLIILLIYRMARLLFFDRFYALTACFLFAITPNIINVVTDVLREPIYLLFVVLSLYYYCRFFRRKAFWDVFYCGLYSSLASLSRWEGIELLFIYIFLLICYSPFPPQKKVLESILLFTITYSIVLSCFFIFFEYSFDQLIDITRIALNYFAKV